MSENTERPVAVWRKRNDALRTMECSNCKADAHYQIVDGVWRYEPYCAHCGARVYKQEDLPMSENIERPPRGLINVMTPKTINKRAVKLVREMRELGARPYNGKNLAEYNRKREALLTLCIEAIENGMRFESKAKNTEEK